MYRSKNRPASDPGPGLILGHDDDDPDDVEDPEVDPGDKPGDDEPGDDIVARAMRARNR
jgi:hypothetical protein